MNLFIHLFIFFIISYSVYECRLPFVTLVVTLWLLDIDLVHSKVLWTIFQNVLHAVQCRALAIPWGANLQAGKIILFPYFRNSIIVIGVKEVFCLLCA